jgi:hypothetical protein
MEDQHGPIGASGGREDNDYDGYKQTEEDRDTTTITKETIKPSELAMIVFDPKPYKKSLEKVNKKSKKKDPEPYGYFENTEGFYTTEKARESTIGKIHEKMLAYELDLMAFNETRQNNVINHKLKGTGDYPDWDDIYSTWNKHRKDAWDALKLKNCNEGQKAGQLRMHVDV